jgi:hypothetical protein
VAGCEHFLEVTVVGVILPEAFSALFPIFPDSFAACFADCEVVKAVSSFRLSGVFAVRFFASEVEWFSADHGSPDDLFLLPIAFPSAWNYFA